MKSSDDDPREETAVKLIDQQVSVNSVMKFVRCEREWLEFARNRLEDEQEELLLSVAQGFGFDA